MLFFGGGGVRVHSGFVVIVYVTTTVFYVRLYSFIFVMFDIN